MKIMIVDDNASIRRTIHSILDQSDDTFCECSDGTEAVKMYPWFRPDWVLMDVRMEKMNGFEATENILASFPDAKIIIVTQYNDREFREKAKHSGARNFVSKEHLMDIEGIIHSQKT